ncbi:unnamed protein product [Trifolium pratense]|uniref:Uncharacterized protein n=1 Tax=Trifolium pratense TaxID=57577 RepID=A0ACB0IYV8_TRIPR|nr:unnamed protein product [Trifolium pratense]
MKDTNEDQTNLLKTHRRINFTTRNFCFLADFDQKSIENTFLADFLKDFGSQLIPLWVIVFYDFWNPQETFLQNFLPKTSTNPQQISCEQSSYIYNAAQKTKKPN